MTTEHRNERMDRRANELVAALARTKKTIENRPRALALSPVVVVDKSRTNETLKWSLARWTMIQQQQVIYVNGVHEIFLGFIGERVALVEERIVK